MTDDVFAIDGDAGHREAALDTYLDPISDERATVDAIVSIKSLRHALVDGVPLRQRFCFRDDSLWWFAELYLHKQQVVLSLFRTLTALEALVEQERPRRMRLVKGGALAQGWRRKSQQRAASRTKVRRDSRPRPRSGWRRWRRERRRSTQRRWRRGCGRERHRRAMRLRQHSPSFIARSGGPIRGTAARKRTSVPSSQRWNSALGTAALSYVSVGPAANFRARRWWHALRGGALPDTVTPVEAYAPLAALNDSRRVWRERHQMRRALWKSTDLRARAVIRGCNCWPVIREELAGIALLQWPWSARAMDEAAAGARRPAAAGGHHLRRSRRLGPRDRSRVPAPRHPDSRPATWFHLPPLAELPARTRRDGRRSSEPWRSRLSRPDANTLFDDYAASHLRDAGRFTRRSLAVTGSPRLDSLATGVQTLSAEAIERAKTEAGAGSRTLVLVTTKHREARAVLRAFLDAAASVRDVHVAIKTHPAETPEVYSDLVAARSNVTVVPASAPLAPLLRASRAVVTVNSTVALDAAVLGLPALVIGLPNNLTPVRRCRSHGGRERPRRRRDRASAPPNPV